MLSGGHVGGCWPKPVGCCRYVGVVHGGSSLSARRGGGVLRAHIHSLPPEFHVSIPSTYLIFYDTGLPPHGSMACEPFGAPDFCLVVMATSRPSLWCILRILYPNMVVFVGSCPTTHRRRHTNKRRTSNNPPPARARSREQTRQEAPTTPKTEQMHAKPSFTRHHAGQARHALLCELPVLGRHAHEARRLRVKVRGLREPQEQVADALA